ncbi:MAG: ABC transporter ATP-binding protein [Eubacterium sp.]|nr:ABC transporter ATP-binding protein [Eubacterium sp.]
MATQKTEVRKQDAMLKVEDLKVNYGVIPALKGISFEVNQGEVIALIGANGAGKTTTLHTITGLVEAASGKILYEGKDITHTPAHRIVSMGIAHVPEGRRVFPEMTVLQNLMLGAYTRKDAAEKQQTLEEVYRHFPRLKERAKQVAGTLSGGEQQMLAMGRALMSRPKLILMDEPSMGLSPIFVTEIFNIIEKVSKQGTTVLLVEQNAKKALSIADRAYVLETGSISMTGTSEELLNNDSIRKAYLGE